MESNGVPGRIHVSEWTAQELRKHGCSNWLEEREDKIVAKGKGEMTTFFVNITVKSMASKSVMSMMTSDLDEDEDEDDDNRDKNPTIGGFPGAGGLPTAPPGLVASSEGEFENELGLENLVDC